jgi:hypothetical protein
MEAREADTASRLARGRVILQRFAERLQTRLIGAGHDLATPRRELVLDGLAAERDAKALVRPRHVHLSAGRTLIQALLDQREPLVEPEPRCAGAPSQELLLLDRRVKRETKRLLNDRSVAHHPNIRSPADRTAHNLSPTDKREQGCT